MIAWAALGKSVLKGGVKKVATDKLLNRKKKTNKRRASVKKMMGMDGKQKEGGEKKGGALAVRPSMDLIPSSKKLDPLSDTAGDSDIVIIKKQVIQVRDILKDSYTIEQEERLGRRKAQQTDKRRIREDKLEKPKVKPKESKGMKGPSLGLGIGNYFSWLAFGIILNKLMDLMPSLKKILSIIKPIAKFIIGAFEKMVGFIIGFIDLSYAGVEKLREGMVAIGGEGAGELFDKFGKLFTQVINGALIAAMIGGRIGLLSKAASLLGFGKGAAATAAAGGATTTTAATATGVGVGAATGIVAGVGLLASGIGEGAFQIKKKGQEAEADWFKRYEEKKWWDPRKAVDWGILQIIKSFNFITGSIGTALDIIGTPFRYLIELIRYPFLDQAGKDKQRENLAKFDARIREQFRETVNAFSLGLLAKDKGAFGSIYGKKGTDAMGYTKDGKTKSEQVPAKRGTILLSTPDLVSTQDFLHGKKSGEKVHSILKMTSTSKEEGLDTHPSYAHGGMIVVENTTTYIQPIEV